MNLYNWLKGQQGIALGYIRIFLTRTITWGNVIKLY